MLDPQILIAGVLNGLLAGGIYVLVAVGLTLIYGVLHIINFAHGSLLMLAMYAVFWLWRLVGLDPYVALPLVTAGAFAFGFVLYRLVIGRFSHGRDENILLITLAFAEVFRILANSVPFTRGGLGMLIKSDPRPLNFQFKDPIWLYYLALALCVVSLVIAWQLTRNRFGARLVAIRENEDAARALGIDVFAEKVRVLTLSGAMCAAGGTFYAQKYLYIDPSIAFGVDKSVEMLLVTMVGGAGTIFGPLIGSIALTTINEVTRGVASVVPALKNVQPLSLVVYGVMLVLIVARLPDHRPA